MALGAKSGIFSIFEEMWLASDRIFHIGFIQELFDIAFCKMTNLQ